MPDTNVFDALGALGKELLPLSRTSDMVKGYTWQLGSICDLVSHTHSIVVEKLDEIAGADTWSEARKAAEELGEDPLTNIFRANHLCDVFQGFGESFRKLAEATADATVPVQTDRNVLGYVCECLEEREARMASLYAHQLQDIGDLLARSGDSPQELDALKAAARKARKGLTSQVAEFDALADRFRKALRSPRS